MTICYSVWVLIMKNIKFSPARPTMVYMVLLINGTALKRASTILTPTIPYKPHTTAPIKTSTMDILSMVFSLNMLIPPF